MSAICAFILTFSTLCGSTGVSGILNSPRNVSLTSCNMNLVIRWSAPEGAAGRNMVYTTEYKTSVRDYLVGCVNISYLECDLTHRIHPSIYESGKYTGRVRAQLGTESSPWVESNQITLDKDTVIGSPNVSLFSNGAKIEVSIKDPVFVISELRKVYNYATYNITYWKDSQKEKARHISNAQQNWVVLNYLDPWTKYCVQVQINTERNPRPSQPSEIVCANTTNEEEAPWVAATVTFVFLALAVALLVVAVVYRKNISRLLCPKDILPDHFKEYLLTPPNSIIYLAMQNSHPPEEIFHHVSIIPHNGTVEEGGPQEVARTTCSKQQSDVTVHGRKDFKTNEKQ